MINYIQQKFSASRLNAENLIIAKEWARRVLSCSRIRIYGQTKHTNTSRPNRVTGDLIWNVQHSSQSHNESKLCEKKSLLILKMSKFNSFHCEGGQGSVVMPWFHQNLLYGKCNAKEAIPWNSPLLCCVVSGSGLPKTKQTGVVIRQ